MLSIIMPAAIFGFFGARRWTKIWALASWLMTIATFLLASYISTSWSIDDGDLEMWKFGRALLGQSVLWLLIGAPTFLLVRWVVTRNDERDGV